MTSRQWFGSKLSHDYHVNRFDWPIMIHFVKIKITESAKKHDDSLFETVIKTCYAMISDPSIIDQTSNQWQSVHLVVCISQGFKLQT